MRSPAAWSFTLACLVVGSWACTASISTPDAGLSPLVDAGPVPLVDAGLPTDTDAGLPTDTDAGLATDAGGCLGSQTDSNNCGECGHVCGADLACSYGACVTYRYVNANPALGNDTTGDGSATAPWHTLQHALDAPGVGGGTTLLLAPGHYQERVVVHQAGSAATGYLTVAPDPQAAFAGPVTIDGTDVGLYPPVFLIMGQSYIALRDLDITNQGWSAQPMGNGVGGIQITSVTDQTGRQVGSDHIVLAGNTLRDIARTDPATGAFVVSVSGQGSSDHPGDTPTRYISIVGNRFTNGATAIGSTGVGQLVLAWNVQDFEIRDNYFSDPLATGVELGGNLHATAKPNRPTRGVVATNTFEHTPERYGVYLQATDSVLVERNFFHDVGWGVGVFTEPEATQAEELQVVTRSWVRNNVFLETINADVIAGQWALDGAGAYLDVEDLYVTNNTAYRTMGANAQSNAFVFMAHANTAIIGDSRVANNLVISNQPPLLLTAPAPLVVDYNLWEAPVGQPVTSTAHESWVLKAPSCTDFFTGPLCNDPASFHLVANADTVRTGENQLPSWYTPMLFGAYAPAVEVDFYGIPRRSDASAQVDRGAAQFP